MGRMSGRPCRCLSRCWNPHVDALKGLNCAQGVNGGLVALWQIFPVVEDADKGMYNSPAPTSGLSPFTPKLAGAAVMGCFYLTCCHTHPLANAPGSAPRTHSGPSKNSLVCASACTSVHPPSPPRAHTCLLPLLRRWPVCTGSFFV